MPQNYLKNRQVLELAFKLRDAVSIEQLIKYFLQEIRSIYADESFYISTDKPEQFSIPINKAAYVFGYLVIPDSYKTDNEAREDFGMLCFLLAEMIIVSKQKQKSREMKQAMIESEARYRLLTENATDVVFKINIAKDIYDYISPSVGDIFGIEQGELYKNHKLIESLLPKDWADFFTNNWKRVEQGILTDFYDYPIIHNTTKELHWVHQSNDWIWDENGILVALQGRIEDITERKVAEQKLQESEKRYEKAQFMGQVGNWEYDPVTNNFWISAESKRIFGLELESIGYSLEIIESCIPDRERTNQALLDLLERDKEYNIEFDIITHDKSERKTIQSIAELERDSEGNPLKVTGVIRDITQLKLKSQALEISENKFRSIYEQSPIAIELYNRDGILIELNQKCLEMFGVDDPKYVLGFDLWTDANLSAIEIEKLRNGEEIEISTLFDFDKMKEMKLFPSSRSGKMYMDVYAIPLVNGTKINGTKLNDNEVDGYLLQILDVTERKNSERKILAEHNKAENYLNIADVILLSLDLSGNITMINPKGCELLGYSKEEIIGKNWNENFVPEGMRKKVREVLSKTENKKPHENLIYTKNGDERLIEWHNSIIYDENGNITGSLSSGNDITDRKIIEEKLIQSLEREQQLADIVRNSPVAIAHGYPDGRLDNCNKAFSDMVGYSVEELIALNWNKVLTPPKWIETETKELSSLTPNNNYIRYEKEYIHKNGSVIPIELVVTAKFDEENRILYFIGFCTDITDRKLAETALRDSEDRLLEAQTLAKLGNWSIDLNTGQATGSRETKRIYGLSEKDSLTTEETQHSHLPEYREQLDKSLAELIQLGKPYDLEFKLKKADSGEIIDVHSLAEYDKEKNIVTGIIQDITDWKLAQRALELSQADLERSQEIAHIGSWRLDIATDQVVWSKELYKIFKLDPALPPPRYGEQEKLFTAESWKLLTRFFAKAVETGVPYELELETIRMDKSQGWMWVRGEAVRDSKGAIVSLAGAAQDITERKQIELNLRESEEKFRALYDNAPLSYQSLNEDGTFRDINPTWLNTLGYKRDEVIGKYFADFLHPDWKPHFETNFPAFKRRGYVSGVEFRIRHKDGSYLDISFEGCVGYYPDGTFRQTYCVFKDITEQKQAELALRESEEKFRIMYKNTPVMLHSIDTQGRLISVSNYWLEKMGYTESEVIGKKSSDFLTNESKKYAEEIALPAFFKAGTCTDVPYQYIKKNGEIIDVLLSAISEKNKDGEVSQSLAVLIDVTEINRAEKALRESEERYHTLFQNTEEGILIANSSDFHFEYANPAICKILGYNIDELLKLSLADIHPDGIINFAQTQFRKLLLKEIDSVKDLTFKRKDDSVIYMDVNANVIKIKGEEKLAGFFTDITERKQADEELAKHREHLEELVAERTKELEYKNSELERFNKLFVGREFRIKELREKVKSLEKKL